MNNKQELLKSLHELAQIKKDLAEFCKEYCKNEANSIADRWEVFKNAPCKNYSSCQEIPDAQEVGMKEKISPYDDWYLDRYGIFDVVERIEDWERDLRSEFKTMWEEELTEEIIDKWKDYYMKRYIGSWKFDW